MSYTKVIQYADIVEVYQYEKRLNTNTTRRHTTLSKLQKQRRRERISKGVQKSVFSARRAKMSFWRLVAHNLERRGVPCLVTLTSADRALGLTRGYLFIREFKRQYENKMGKTFTYIAVPEWQKKGRLHFHLIIWGIPELVAQSERATRNLQRLYARGYLDVRVARDSSPKIASYLAKYMSKAYSDKRLGGRRCYTTSREIDKPTTFGSNTLSSYLTDIIPVDNSLENMKIYDTVWLGKCQLTKYKIKKYDY